MTFSQERMSKFQSRVTELNRLPPQTKLVPFLVEGKTAGEVFEKTASMLLGYDAFRLDDGKLLLSPELESSTPAERTKVLAKVADDLRERGVVTGWRNELVTVAASFGAPPVFSMERAAYPLFGIAGYGVHVNGFVRDGATPGGVRLWVATRSRRKPTWPGLRDHIVAGQISAGFSPTATVVKEAEEEAGIPATLAATARCVGAVSYRGVDEGGRLKRDVLFCYDLELPRSFVPSPVDGEVEGFELWDLERVCRLLEGIEPGPSYKPNVALVVLDFLVRWGVIGPDSPGYLPLVASLRSGTCG
jgi:8-oxo-dGTP pyrophosphatase MutT (NUDIX family)